MNSNGWEQLDCPYFADTCREVMGGHLEKYGLREKASDASGILFVLDTLFVEFSYDTNLFPNYTTHVLTGFRKRAHGKQDEFNGVPMWYLLPVHHPYRRRVHWTFTNKQELEKVFHEIGAEFLEPILMPLLASETALKSVVTEFNSEWEKLE